MITFLIFLFFAIAVWRLLVKLNTGFPVFELTIVLYTLQYLIAAIFGYQFNRYMAIPKEAYLGFTFGVILAFAIGLFSLKSKLNFKPADVDEKTASKLGKTLLGIGIISQVFISILPAQFAAIFNFFILFQSIGIYALLFSNQKWDKLIIVSYFILVFIEAIIGSMMIDLIVFILFFFMFFSLKYKTSLVSKLALVTVVFALFTLYQGIKIDYRKITWKDDVSLSEKLHALDSLVNKKTIANAFSADIQNNKALVFTMNRLNQGWQTSKVYRHVPNNVDFEYGKDFLNDILSCFVPRVFWKDKRVVNDQERFTYYTGYQFKEDISVSFGVIGDFYLNFGIVGTIVVMFLFGYFAARLKRLFEVKFIAVNPINLIWIPFVFSYFIRPGNEFYMVLNHIIKSIFILVFVFGIIYPILGIQLFSNKK